MFTGIIRDVGRVIEVIDLGFPVGKRIAIVTKLAKTQFEMGCSVACNGVCLTVVGMLDVPSTSETILEFDVGPETIERTTYAMLAKGLAVNLEPALRVGDSLGGHELTGHVDQTGTVVSLERTQDSDFWRLTLSLDLTGRAWCMPQGSVAIEGTSLTLAKIETKGETFQLEIMLVPHTMSNTRLGDLVPGSLVNVEFDSKVKTIVETIKSILPHVLKSNP